MNLSNTVNIANIRSETGNYSMTPIAFAASDETTALEAGQLFSMIIPYDCTITGMFFSLNGTGSTQSLQMDAIKTGSTILSGPVTLSVGSYTGASSGFVGGDYYNLERGDTITINLDQADTTASGIKGWIMGYPRNF